MNRNVEKGKHFERRVAQLLTEAMGYPFFRSVVNSTVAMHHDRKIYGDVISSDAGFPFCVECKAYKTFSIDAIMNQNLTMFKKFWQQARKQGRDAEKRPMLAVTNGRQAYVFVLHRHINLPILGTTRTLFSVDGEIIVGMEINQFFKYLKEAL